MVFTRNVPLRDRGVALLVVDAQNYAWVPGKGVWADAPEGAPSEYFWRRVEAATANIASLLDASRARPDATRVERVFTVIEALTRDQRDLSLDYKISKLGVSRGSWEAQVIDAIKPEGDEILLPKTSSSVFVSTNISQRRPRRDLPSRRNPGASVGAGRVPAAGCRVDRPRGAEPSPPPRNIHVGGRGAAAVRLGGRPPRNDA